MPTPLYYTVYIINGRYPNATCTEVMGTYDYNAARDKVKELEAQGLTAQVNY